MKRRFERFVAVVLTLVFVFSFGSNAFAVDVSSETDGSQTILLEAENAELSGGAQVNTDHEGYSGTGFVSGFMGANASLTFSTEISVSGFYTLAVRYSSGYGTHNTAVLSVNDERIENPDFPKTENGWDGWGTITTEKIYLTKGTNTIQYANEAGGPGVNFDYLELSLEQAVEPIKLEAEEAELGGDVTVGTEHAGYSGSGYVQGFTDYANASVTFKPNVSVAGVYNLTVGYAAGYGTHKGISLYVNDDLIENPDFSGAWGTWATWRTYTTENVYLNAGENTILYDNTEKWPGINLDYLELELVSPGEPKVKYAVTIDQQMTGGTIVASRTEAPEDATVTLELEPEIDYHNVENSLKVYKSDDPNTMRELQ